MIIGQKTRGVGWVLFDRENKKVGIHRRDANAPTRCNMWDHFGGEFEKGEDKTELDTLKREITEELNIVIDEASVHELSRKDGQIMYWIDFSFDGFCQIRLGEGAGLAWITLDGALSLNDITPEAREALELLKSV